MDLVYALYILALFLACTYSAWRGRGCAVAAAMVVAYAWMIGELATSLLHWYVPAPVFILVDLGCVAYFATRRDRCAHIFAATYLPQLALHALYEAGTLDKFAYWWAHTSSAYVQLVVLIVWATLQKRARPAGAERA